MPISTYGRGFGESSTVDESTVDESPVDKVESLEKTIAPQPVNNKNTDTTIQKNKNGTIKYINLLYPYSLNFSSLCFLFLHKTSFFERKVFSEGGSGFLILLIRSVIVFCLFFFFFMIEPDNFPPLLCETIEISLGDCWAASLPLFILYLRRDYCQPFFMLSLACPSLGGGCARNRT